MKFFLNTVKKQAKIPITFVHGITILHYNCCALYFIHVTQNNDKCVVQMMFTFTPSTNKNLFLHSKIPDFVPRQTHHLCVLNDGNDAIQHFLKTINIKHIFFRQNQTCEKCNFSLVFFHIN